MCNLSHVLYDRSEKDRRKVARLIFRNWLRNYFDLLRVHKLTIAQRRAEVELRGLEHVHKGFERGKGVLAVSGHQGSFSFISQVATIAGFDFFLAVEPIEPPELFDLVRKLREIDPRSHTIAVGGTEIRTIFRALKDNHMVCLAIDRDVTGSGKPLTFFGTEAILPTGAAEVALRTGATVVSAVLGRQPSGKKILEFYPGFVAEPTGDKQADIFRVSSQMLKEIEKRIREAPGEWVVLQPVWPDCQ